MALQGEGITAVWKEHHNAMLPGMSKAQRQPKLLFGLKPMKQGVQRGRRGRGRCGQGVDYSCSWFASHLQAVVGHVDVSMHIGHWVLEVGAVYGCFPELCTALYHWLALLPGNPAHRVESYQSSMPCFSAEA